ncbi:MAG: hypothetical protein AAF467_09690 [Actinomycetota bacterium]
MVAFVDYRVGAVSAPQLERLDVGGGATATAGRGSASRASRVPVAGIAVAVAVVLGLVVGARFAQGEPPASDWSELVSDPRAPAPALAGPGDLVVVATAGDSLWSLAGEHAPAVERRAAVDEMVAVNGGSSLAVGQEVVIPASLLGGS